ncbi:villin-1 [Patella vulgata]|uniref:villin-1 n=1 Tax=Patella vulgata TaxID=6465 RepID=UPI0021804F17|nr:villin-1 [Patella vulgata]
MLILMGGINNDVEDTNIKMYHIRGTNDVNTRAIQVPCRAASLNSNDVFIVQSDSSVFLWLGKGASLEEIEVAKNVAQFICPDRDLKMVDEEDEPEEFWDIVGEREPYPTGPRLQNASSDMPCRLFQCSNASGRFQVEEIIDFTQEDLVEDDVMLLDTFDEIFVWVGKGANRIEKKESLNAAMEYIRTDPAGRTPDTTMIAQVKQGFEPPNFTGHFHGWDPEKWSKGKTYEELKEEFGEEETEVTSVQEEIANYSKTYTYKVLLQKPVPAGVDPASREKHLSDTEFKEVFKMSKQDYETKPQWKRTALKKQVGLF